jgi:cytidine deaminase
LKSSELYAQAKDVRRLAYAPYSHFEVGAALLASDGRVFTGVNVENASYALSLCAERSALAAAIGGGARAFTVIAIAGPQGASVPPCGACRQALAEFGESIAVVFAGDDGELVERPLAALLPHAFGLRRTGEVPR